MREEIRRLRARDGGPRRVSAFLAPRRAPQRARRHVAKTRIIPREAVDRRILGEWIPSASARSCSTSVTGRADGREPARGELGSLEDETEEETYDNHLADSATATLNREIDYTLEENSEHVLTGSRRRSRGSRPTFGSCAACGRRSTRSDSRPPVRDEVYRLPASRREGLVNPSARLIDVRVGSATDGRVPISMVERSLSATPFHWFGLLAAAFAAVVADQVTKQIVVSQLELGESVHRRAARDSHVTNPGIAFGLFSSRATADDPHRGRGG